MSILLRTGDGVDQSHGALAKGAVLVTRSRKSAPQVLRHKDVASADRPIAHRPHEGVVIVWPHPQLANGLYRDARPC